MLKGATLSGKISGSGSLKGAMAIPTGIVDLSNYYTKEEIDDKYSNLHLRLVDVEDAVEVIRNRYQTEDDVQALIDASIAKIAVYEGETEDVAVITFYVVGGTYQAKSGMTWLEFVNSEYNPNGRFSYIEEKDQIIDTGMDNFQVVYGIDPILNPVKADDRIFSEYAYDAV